MLGLKLNHVNKRGHNNVANLVTNRTSWDQRVSILCKFKRLWFGSTSFNVKETYIIGSLIRTVRLESDIITKISKLYLKQFRSAALSFWIMI